MSRCHHSDGPRNHPEIAHLILQCFGMVGRSSPGLAENLGLIMASRRSVSKSPSMIATVEHCSDLENGESAPAMRAPLPVPAVVPGAACGLLMLGLGVWGAARAGLRADEVATVEVARRTPGQILETITTIDAVFLPYYLFMHFWTRVFGDSELALRAPSIIAMAFAVGLTAELGRRLFDPVVGALAGLFMCLIPHVSRYAQEARPYAMSCLLAVVATLLLHRALAGPSARRWTGYGAAVLLLGGSHLLALTVLGGHAVAVAGQARRTGARPAVIWLATVAAAGAALLPLALLGAGQRDAQLNWVEPVTAARIAAAPGDVVGSVDTGWLLAGMALLALWWPRRRLVELAAWLAVPPAVVATASVLAEPLWVARYLLVVLPPLALLAALGVAGRGGPAGPPARGAAVTTGQGAAVTTPARGAAVTTGQGAAVTTPARGAAVTTPGRGAAVSATVRILIVVLVVAATAYPEQRRIRAGNPRQHPHYREVAGLIQDRQQPGDGIVYQGGWSKRAGVEHYLRGAARRPPDLLLRRSAADVDGLVAAEHTDPVAHVRGVPRVWLVVGAEPADPAAGKPALTALLHTGYDRIALWRMGFTTVALYQRRR
jgi:mannosyltransferase